MLRLPIISKSFAVTPILLAALLASSASGAPHDGPGAFCQTHIGWSYVAAGGLVHARAAACVLPVQTEMNTRCKFAMSGETTADV